MNPALNRDNRKEPRRFVNGEVRVRFENPKPQEIQGRLVDVSLSGFRMAHDYAALEAGQVVEFSHIEAVGRAPCRMEPHRQRSGGDWLLVVVG